MDRSTPSAATVPAHSLRGTLLFVLGLFLFACMDTTIKILAAHYPVPMIVAVRYVVHCALMVALLAPTMGRELLRTRRTGWVLVRAACLAVASLCLGLALQRMPVAESTALLFVAPLFVVLAAGPVLGEKVGLLGWVAAAAGFGGVLLIARPGVGLDPAGVAFALGAAAVTSVYGLLSRMLASTERTVPMLFYTALVGAVAFGLAAPWFWGGPEPTLLQGLLFLSIGVYGGLGHFLFTAAHRDAPASVLAPIAYAQLGWACLLGWIVFGHVPEPSGLAGILVIAAAGVLAALKSRFARRTPVAPVE